MLLYADCIFMRHRVVLSRCVDVFFCVYLIFTFFLFLSFFIHFIFMVFSMDLVDWCK